RTKMPIAWGAPGNRSIRPIDKSMEAVAFDTPGIGRGLVPARRGITNSQKRESYSMRIDSHQHFWQIDRGDYSWMSPEMPDVLRHDYLPEQVRSILESHQIAKSVLVQAADTTAETDFLLTLARRETFIAGVVGWLDLARHDFAEQLAMYRKDSNFVGV